MGKAPRRKGMENGKDQMEVYTSGLSGCMRAWVRACVCAYVCAPVRVRACVHLRARMCVVPSLKRKQCQTFHKYVYFKNDPNTILWSQR